MADEYDGVIGIPIDPTERAWSASQFTVLGQCPYRWFAQKLLGLRSADEADTSLSPAVRGSLYHKTLELAVQRSSNASDLRTAVLEVLDECFCLAESDPDVGLPKLDNWPLQRAEHLRALRNAVNSRKFIEQGAQVVASELKFETTWNDLAISGRIDRVDRTADGLIAVDYKTSSSPPHGIKNESGKSNIDIQLALYAQIALPHLFPGEPVKKGLYYSLTKGKVLKEIELAKMHPLREIVDKIHDHLRAGNFAVDPDIDGNACKYCEFDAMCRKGTRLARKTRS
jgi:RecB family exonuclease